MGFFCFPTSFVLCFLVQQSKLEEHLVKPSALFVGCSFNNVPRPTKAQKTSENEQ